jgi:hypothetical protein
MFVWPVFFSPFFLKKKEGKGETSLKCAHLSCAAGLFPSLFLSRIRRIPYTAVAPFFFLRQELKEEQHKIDWSRTE